MDFFSHLEMHLRQEHPPLSGRDHMSYRSSYFPVKDVIDGDLCEQYTQVKSVSCREENSRKIICYNACMRGLKIDRGISSCLVCCLLALFGVEL